MQPCVYLDLKYQILVHYLSVSFSSPPKAATVLMEERTSSATLPAFAYAFTSRAVKPAANFM